jgi:hypothetical protein
MGDQLPPGIGLRHQLEGTRLTIDLLYDTQQWTEKFAIHPPRIRLLDGNTSGSTYEIAWKRIAPGRFSLTHDLEEGTLIRGAIQLGEHAIPFGPIIVGSNTEWAFDPDRLAELRTTSAQTGGRELLDLSHAWLRPPVIHSTNFRIPLALTILFLILLDAFVTRTGWKLPLPALASPSSKKTTTPLIKPPPTLESTPEPTQSTPPTHSPTSRSSRFSRAKRRK